MNETETQSEKVKNIIREDNELAVVYTDTDNEVDRIIVTSCDDEMYIDDLEQGKKLAVVEINNNVDKVNIHEYVTYNNDNTFGNELTTVELEMNRFEDISLDNMVNMIDEIVGEYYVIGDLEIVDNDGTVIVESKYANLVFDKLQKWNENGKKDGVDPDETDLIYRDNNSDKYYTPSQSEIEKVPENVIEALDEAGYTVYSDGIDSGWLNWGGRPDFDESVTYVDLSDAVIAT